MPVRTFIEAIRDGMAEEMRRDESVVVLGEDVGKKGGVFLATDGLWGEFGDDRVIDTPLTESMIVGASIGAAINGLRPVAEIQFADFIHPGVQPAGVRGGPDALPLEQRVLGADGRAGAVRRRRARRALPLAVGRGVLHPRAGPQGRDPVDAVRRQGAAADRDPRRRPGAVLRAQEDVPQRPRRGARRRLRGAPGLGRHPPDRQPGHGDRVRADDAVCPRGRRAGGGGGDRRRGGRHPVAPAARPGHDPVVRAQDRQVPRGLRGQPVRRLRGGDLRDRRRGGVRLPRRPGGADRRPRCPGRARTTTRSRTGSCSARRRSPTRSGSSPRTDGPRRADLAAVEARLQRILDPYRDRLEPATIYSIPTLRRAGREGARLVRVREAGLEARQLLPDADRDLARRCSTAARRRSSPDGTRRSRRSPSRPLRRGAVRASSRRSWPGRSSGTSARARRARRSRRRAPRPGTRRSAPPPRRWPTRSAFVSRRHGATRIASRPFSDLVGPRGRDRARRRSPPG